MDYKKLADTIRKFANIELLANEVESIGDEQNIDTIDDLTEFLETELEYADYV